MFSVRHWRRPELNERAVQEFGEAVDYLSGHSRFAADLICDLRSSTKRIEVLVNFGEPAARANGWVGPRFDLGGSGGTVTWNASREKVEGERSAAMGLMHELGHVYQFLSEKSGMKAVLKPRFFGRCYQTGKQARIVHSQEFIERIEDTNVAAIELTVANEINATLSEENAPAPAFEPTRSSYI